MQTFRKEERLSSTKLIELLFSSGQSFTISPFRVIWMKYDEPLSAPARLLVSVSKKYHKRAVDRNLIKRRIREAYRRNKSPFYSFLAGRGEYCLLALIYTGLQLKPSWEIEEKIISVLNRLQENYSKHVAAEQE
jgi:ribonuclease P protein component